MAVNYFIPKKHSNSAKLLSVEKHFLQKHFPFLEVKIQDTQLKCTGRCKPSPTSLEYTYVVKYIAGKHPNVFLLDPQISYNEDIHMYPENKSLCLHFSKDFSWTSRSHLYDTIIPWTHEWFVFYELYTIHGIWFHPFVSHKPNQKIKN